MKKLKKLTALLAALALVFVLGSCANGSKNDPTNQPTIKETLESIDGVYYYEYAGDYKLEDCINADLKTEYELLTYLYKFIPELLGVEERSVSFDFNSNGFACCSITANNAGSAGGKIYGRNFDYPNSAAMVVHTKPTTGYESISTCYPAFVTLKDEWAPENEMAKTFVGAASIFAPLDGMNEKGFYISVLQLDREETNQTAEGKHDIQTTVAIRYLLDNADSVEKALELLDGFNMHNVFNTAYHFALADTTGKSVVVEYINNVKYVSETKVVTNHYLTPNSGKPAPASTDNTLLRYNAAFNAGESVNWNMTPEQVRDALNAASASQHHINDPDSTLVSIWSAVFEPSIKKVTYYFREDYTKGFEVTF